MTSKRLSKTNRRDIATKLASGFRHKLLAHPIVEKRQFDSLYWEHLPDELSGPLQTAFSILGEYKAALNETFRERNRVTFNLQGNYAAITSIVMQYPYRGYGSSRKGFDFPDLRIYTDQFDWGVTGDMMPIAEDHGMYPKLYEWSLRRMRVQIQEYIIQQVIKNVIEDKCSTTGHIMRVWPAIVDLLPSHLADTLRDARRGSPEPHGITNFTRFWIPLVTKWLTQGLLIRNHEQSNHTMANIETPVMSLDIDWEVQEEVLGKVMYGVDPYKIAQVGIME